MAQGDERHGPEDVSAPMRHGLWLLLTLLNTALHFRRGSRVHGTFARHGTQDPGTGTRDQGPSFSSLISGSQCVGAESHESLLPPCPVSTEA